MTARMTGMAASLRTDRGGTAALEFALVFPVLVLFIFGCLSAVDLIQARRAMDYGVEKALRYAVVHGGGGTAGPTSAYFKAAGIIHSGVGTSGTSSSVQVTPTGFAAGQTVTVTATYTWNPPADYVLWATPMFGVVTLTATGTMLVLF